MMGLLLFLGCGPSYTVIEGDTALSDLDDATDPADSGDTADSADEAMWDGASLVVLSPESGDFLPLGDDAAFEAVVYDADGQEMDFDEITWASDVDGAWTPTGAAFTDDTLGVGTHALTATARLPNGDRLAYTVGGVLVQSPYAGIYVGTLSVIATGDYNGQTISTGCSGAATITVDAEGETATGESDCLLVLGTYELDMAFLVDLDNAEGTLGGVIAADIYGYTYDFDAAGTMDEDGALSAAFTGDLFGYATIDGSVDATRVTRDVSGQ